MIRSLRQAQRIVGRHNNTGLRHGAPRPDVSHSVLNFRDDDDESNGFSVAHHNHHRVRRFHRTPRREILPLVAVGVVAVVGRYSYRAMQRMDEEWEDYEDKRREYEAKWGHVTASGRRFLGGYVGIDLGSTNLRVSHLPVVRPKGARNDPVVVENRQGERSTPALAESVDVEPLLGTMAQKKMYERTMYANQPQIRRLRERLEDATTTDDAVLRHALRAAAGDALEKVAPLGDEREDTVEPLFTDDNDSTTSHNLRPVFTYDPSASETAVARLTSVANALSSGTGVASLVPEPVATCVGARHFGILPSRAKKVAVLDVGGSALSLSVLDVANKDAPPVLLHQASLPDVAGSAVREALVGLLTRDFYDDDDDGVAPDGAALQRLHDAAESAVAELARNSRTNVNVPYLTMDPVTRKPRHLERGVGADVLRREVDALVASRAPSSSPPVTGAASLVTDALSRALQDADCPVSSPFELDAVLLVGGGARSPVFRNGVREGLAALGGEAYAAERLIVPEDELVEELTVLGAALCGDDDDDDGDAAGST